MQPQAQGCLEPPEAGRGRKDPPREPALAAWPCQHLDLGLLASRLCENTFGCFKPLVCGVLVQEPQGAKTAPKATRAAATSCLRVPGQAASRS